MHPEAKAYMMFKNKKEATVKTTGFFHLSFYINGMRKHKTIFQVSG